MRTMGLNGYIIETPDHQCHWWSDRYPCPHGGMYVHPSAAQFASWQTDVGEPPSGDYVCPLHVTERPAD